MARYWSTVKCQFREPMAPLFSARACAAASPVGLAVLWMVMKRGCMEWEARRARERGDMKSRLMCTSRDIWDMVRGTGGTF